MTVLTVNDYGVYDICVNFIVETILNETEV